MTSPATEDDDDTDVGSSAAGKVLAEGARLCLTYVKRCKAIFSMAVLGAAIYGVLLVVGTEVIGYATDEILIPTFDSDAERGSLGWLVAALIGISVLRSSGVVMRRYFGAMTTERNNKHLRWALGETYLDQSITDLKARPTGELLAHADTDVEVSTMLLQPLPFTLGMFVLAAAASISLLSIDIWLLGVASLVFPATWLANRIFTQKVIAPASKVRKAVGDVTAVVHESLDGALVVKTLGREADEVQRLTESADRLRRTRTQIGRLRATFEPTLDTLPSLGMVAVLAIGAWRISDGNVTTGQVIQAMILFQQLAFPIRIIGFFLEENAMSVVAARRLKKAFKVSAPLAAAGTETLDKGPLIIEFNNVTYGYGNQTVLKDCSFQIDKGEIVALVGETGSGKTTIAQLLFGLIEPHRGSIKIGNYQLPEINSEILREHISLVSQETFLFADDLKQNVKLYRQIDNSELDKHAKTAQADFVNEMPGRWETLVGERGVTLSGGQRQRIAITRALVGDPGFLMLDDSTSAIDPILEGEILEALRKNLSTTTLVVAHRLSTIKLAKRVLFLHQGSIVASGSHEELLKNSDYADLVKAYERDSK